MVSRLAWQSLTYIPYVYAIFFEKESHTNTHANVFASAANRKTVGGMAWWVRGKTACDFDIT